MVDWNNAPKDAEFYANGSFRKYGYFFGGDGMWIPTGTTRLHCRLYYSDYRGRPQSTTKQPAIAQDAPKPQNAYQRTIIGLDGSKCVVDVYRVLEAFEVDSHAIAHSIKKLLAPGKRHAKSREQDLREAIASIEAELLLMSQR